MACNLEPEELGMSCSFENSHMILDTLNIICDEGCKELLEEGM